MHEIEAIQISNTNLEVVPADELIVIAKKNEYLVVNDNLYAGTGKTPQWLQNAIDNAIALATAGITSKLNASIHALTAALMEMDIARNTYQELINIEETIDGVIASRLATLNATVAQNSADIIHLDVTKATPTNALALSINHLNAEIYGGQIKSAVTRLDSAIASATRAAAASYANILAVAGESFAEINTTLETEIIPGIRAHTEQITEMDLRLEGVDDLIAEGNSEIRNEITATANDITALWAYGSNVRLGNGDVRTAGFGLTNTASGIADLSKSEFWVEANKFRLSSGNTAVPVFTVDTVARQAIFNGKVIFGNGQTGTIDEAIASSEAIIAAQETANTANTNALARPLPSEVAAAINNNTTTINGSKITTGSIAADRINTYGLIAENISSTSLDSKTITSSTIKGAYIEGAIIKASYLDLDGELEVLTNYHIPVSSYNAVTMPNAIYLPSVPEYRLTSISNINIAASQSYGTGEIIIEQNSQSFVSNSVFCDIPIYAYNSYTVISTNRCVKIRPDALIFNTVLSIPFTGLAHPIYLAEYGSSSTITIYFGDLTLFTIIFTRIALGWYKVYTISVNGNSVPHQTSMSLDVPYDYSISVSNHGFVCTANFSLYYDDFFHIGHVKTGSGITVTRAYQASFTQDLTGLSRGFKVVLTDGRWPVCNIITPHIVLDNMV